LGKKRAVVGATLIDGKGGVPIPDSAVVVEGKRIVGVGPQGEVEVPADADVIDGGEMWLLPGLIDLHVHIFHGGYVPYPIRGNQMAYAAVVAVNNLRSALQTGITTLRDVCDVDHLDLAMRTAVERGQLLGPRIFSAGRGICMTGGHASGQPGAVHEVDTPWDVRKAVRTEVKAGVDLIKLLSSHRTDRPEFSQEEIDAGVDEAHRLGRKVAIHAANFESVRMAARARVDTIEHGSHIDDESAELMAEKGIILVPTLMVKNYIPQLIAEKRGKGEALWNLDPKDLEETDTWFKRCVEQLPKTMELVRSKGVRIGAGTDDVFSETPFALLPEEMEWMTRYGMTNMEVIESATRVGAEALGVEHALGTVEAGKYADLILVGRDPLEDIAVFKDVSWVMKEGDVVPMSPEWKRRPVAEPMSL
jgi:imidazolonepropionase-like amidohydrolase